MFQLITSNTTTTPQSTTYGTGLFQFGSPPAIGIIGFSLLGNDVVDAIPTVEDGILVVEAPPNLNYLTGVSVNGQMYVASTIPEIVGTSYWNIVTNLITVYLYA